MRPTLELTISPTGETKLETKGFAGGTCREASLFWRQALGTVASEQLTADFYQPNQQQEQQRLPPTQA